MIIEVIDICQVVEGEGTPGTLCRPESGRDWERLGETGRDWERLGETGRDWERNG